TILLAIPAAVAASFVVHLNVTPSAAAHEPTEQERKVRRRQEEAEVKERQDAEIQELKQKIETTTDAEVKAKLEADLKKRIEQQTPAGYAVTLDGDRYKFLVNEEGQRREREMEQKHNTILAQMAKISMDQAIQIATSKNPGKVLECSLVGERWSSTSEQTKASQVFYHVLILSGDQDPVAITHVLVNAIDGSIVKSEREERRREGDPES